MVATFDVGRLMTTGEPGGEDIATIRGLDELDQRGLDELDQRGLDQLGLDRRGLDPRTGEPRRPGVIWAATALFYAGIGAVTAGLLLAFWQSIDTFETAAWLNGVWPTEPGSGWRVPIVTALFLVTVLIGYASIVAGYYAWLGYAWTRWAGLVAVAVSLLALLMNPLAIAGIPLVAAGAALLWTPASRRFFGQWTALRHPEPTYPTVVDEVYYGPLPRYR